MRSNIVVVKLLLPKDEYAIAVDHPVLLMVVSENWFSYVFSYSHEVFWLLNLLPKETTALYLVAFNCGLV